MSEDTIKRKERHIIREERLSRPEKMALEEEVAQPGAEYVEVSWRKTAREDLTAIRSRIDALIRREGGPARERRTTVRGESTDLPPGLRSRITEAYGSAVAHVRLAYSTKEHHVCRVGLRKDGKVREIVVLVTPDDVRPVETVEAAVDELTGGVVISALQFDPPGPDEGDNLIHEWVELTNRNDEPVDLTGYRLEDRSGHGFEFPDGFILEPGASVKVRTGEGEDTATDLHWGRRAAVWTNTGDKATLRDPEGRFVHHKSWSPED